MRAVIFIILLFVFVSCQSRQAPIITSATHQHTLYNGRGQAIEAKTARRGAPQVITYFRSEADLLADRDGTQEPPVEVGDYFVRIRRPAGNGYMEGRDITVEFHIQKALVTIIAEARQEFVYDGRPKSVVFTVDQNVEPAVTYFVQGSSSAISGNPIERGIYSAVISYSGDAHHMGSSKSVEVVIR
jgi:hypothetical protein